MQEVRKYDEKKPIAAQLRTMEVGDVIAFPVVKVGYIRSNLSTFGLMYGSKYSSHINREAQSLEVTRCE